MLKELLAVIYPAACLIRDVAVYALGVGACTDNAVDEKELNYVYHRDGQQFIKVVQFFKKMNGSGFEFVYPNQ